MKMQSLFVLASALAGVIAMPIAEPDPLVKTVIKKVVHVNTITRTVWVSPSTAVPEGCNKMSQSEPISQSYPQHVDVPKVLPPPAPPSPATVKPPQDAYISPLSVPSYRKSPQKQTQTQKPKIKKPSKAKKPKKPKKTKKSKKPKSKPKPVYPASIPKPVPPPPAVTPVYVPQQAYQPSPPSYGPSAPPVKSQSSGQAVIEGQATYYAPGLGSCGGNNTEDEDIVAISHEIMTPLDGGNPNKNPKCGKQIKVQRNGKSVVCTVVDKCPGCNSNTVDLSPHAFQILGTLDEGRIDVQWEWLD